MNVLKSLMVAALVLGLSFAALAADPKRNLAVAKTPAAATEQRVALVIGNSAYKSAPLANPVNDARAISAKLRTLGFEVIVRENLTQKQVGAVLREFRSKLKPGGVALFFYAGHGLQVKGVNYFPVVDADIASEEDVPTQSLDANKVLELMDEAKTRLNLVFLDACRNNPYARSFRSAADGLAKVNAPSGTVISFATRPGSVAADAGSGRNGLYTEHLLAAMDLPDTAIEQALKRVVSGVKQASKGRQEPWMEGSIEGDFYFRWTGRGAQAARPPAAVDPAAIELAFWESIKGSQSAEDYKEYLKKYPNGQFAGIAKRRALNQPKPATTAVATIAPVQAAKPKPEPDAAAGKPVLGWLGVSIQQVTPELAKQFGLSETKGALVSGVIENSPAAAAGLRSGDVITSFDGKAVDEPGMLRYLATQTPIGISVKLEVLRDRKTIGMSATIAPLPATKPEPAAVAGEIRRDGRFIAYDNGTVLDTRTNLIWAAKDNGSNINWAGAKSYSEHYRGGGYTDWRMPTRGELGGLHDESKTYESECRGPLGGAWDIHATELIRITCGFSWTSETGSDNDARFIDFERGVAPLAYRSVSSHVRVLPVRSAK